MATSGIASAIGQVIHAEALDSDHEKARWSQRHSRPVIARW